MRTATTRRLLLAVVALGLFIVFVERRLLSTDQRHQAERRVLSPVPQDVAALRIERGGLKAECARSGEAWTIVQPIRAAAERGAVERLVGALEALPRYETITAEERGTRSLSLSDYGLDAPQARVAIRDPLGWRELAIGRDAELGGQVYVRLGTSEDVIATSRSILDAVPERLDDLRDRAVFGGTPSRVNRLEIQSPASGFIQVLRAGDRWTLQQPLVARADGADVERILAALYALKAELFVWDRATDGSAPTEAGAKPGESFQLFGLADDEATARITLWTEGAEASTGLMLGKTVPDRPGLVYAALQGRDSICAVSNAILKAIAVAPNDLRDRNLFDGALHRIVALTTCKEDLRIQIHRLPDRGWVLVEPVNWKADNQMVEDLVRQLAGLRADAFLDAEATNLSAQSLAPPLLTVELSAALPAPAAESTNEAATTAAEMPRRHGDAPPAWQLLVGREKSRSGRRFGKLAGEPTLFEFSSDAVEWLVRHGDDPLSFRDRTMLAIPPQAVTRLAVQRAGVEQAVDRAGATEWTASPPATNPPNAAAIESVLFAVANLRAVRTECHGSTNLAPYALDQPADRLTLGLTESEGIQKTVLLGLTMKDGSRYAMVQGQDVVFVLEATAWRALLGDIAR